MKLGSRGLGGAGRNSQLRAQPHCRPHLPSIILPAQVRRPTERTLAERAIEANGAPVSRQDELHRKARSFDPDPAQGPSAHAFAHA
jgi:hypothetical protein